MCFHPLLGTILVQEIASRRGLRNDDRTHDPVAVEEEEASHPQEHDLNGKVQ